MRKTIIFIALLGFVFAGAMVCPAGIYLTTDVSFTAGTADYKHDSILSYQGTFSTYIDSLVPAGVEITAISLLGNQLLFAVDRQFDGPGETFGNWQIITYDLGANTYELFSDLSTVIPESTVIDALHVLNPNMFLFSIDIPATISGQAFSESDVLLYEDGTVYLHRSADDLQIEEGQNLDALSFAKNKLYLSLDVPASIGGLLLREADVARADPSSFVLVFDADRALVPPGVNVVAFMGYLENACIPCLMLLLAN
jgi:hypothetical protein